MNKLIVGDLIKDLTQLSCFIVPVLIFIIYLLLH